MNAKTVRIRKSQVARIKEIRAACNRTTDRSPSTMAGVVAGLASRLEGGLRQVCEHYAAQAVNVVKWSHKGEARTQYIWDDGTATSVLEN